MYTINPTKLTSRFPLLNPTRGTLAFLGFIQNFIFFNILSQIKYLFIISGLPKFEFTRIHKGFRGESIRKMALNLERCENIVRPATEVYVDEAVEALRGGKVIAVPTDTLYGFACDAWYVF